LAQEVSREQLIPHIHLRDGDTPSGPTGPDGSDSVSNLSEMRAERAKRRRRKMRKLRAQARIAATHFDDWLNTSAQK
jgi:hypothetical protein